MLQHIVISMADYTLQEKESKVNGWGCVSIGTCEGVFVCRYL